MINCAVPGATGIKKERGRERERGRDGLKETKAEKSQMTYVY